MQHDKYHELRDQITEQSTIQLDTTVQTDIHDAITEEPEMSLPELQFPKRAQSMDFQSLQERYPEVSGWILAEGAGGDYPIMHTKDNEFYLSHLYDGSYNSNRSIFIDYRNSGIFTDDNTVIYGHNMKNGEMFQGLNEYKYQEFYKIHPTITIYTPNGDCCV